MPFCHFKNSHISCKRLQDTCIAFDILCYASTGLLSCCRPKHLHREVEPPLVRD